MDINQISASDWLDAVKKKKTDWYKENGLPVPDFTKEEDFYIVNAIENDIRALVDKELTSANERFPQFHSQHEGYAVILEETDEIKEQLEAAETYLGYMWDRVKHDSPVRSQAENLVLFFSNVACEAVQAAAMAKKFLEMERNKND